MKLVCAFVVLLSVGAASAKVTENIKVYKPTLKNSVNSVVKPIVTPKPKR